jgi:xylulokinase
MKRFFIGVDLGTSGIKAGVVSQNLEVVSSSYWEADMEARSPGRMRQDIESYYEKTLRIIGEVRRKSKVPCGNIDGIAFCGQMGGVIGIDRNFNSITGLDMGLDIRSEKYNEILHSRLDRLLFQRTCGSPRNTPKILWWKNEHGEIYSKVFKFVTLTGYVAGKMANLKGEEAFIDYTLISFFGNEDARGLKWDENLNELLEIDSDKLPRIVSPSSIVGCICGGAARACGLQEGTPIVAGLGDQPAGLLGAGFSRTGMLLDVSGSTVLLFQCVDEFRPDTEKRTVMYIPSAVPGKYYAFSYINGGGIDMKWLQDQFSIGRDKSVFNDLNAKAESVPPGSGGLIFIPYFGGRQCPYNAAYRGGWLGLNWGHKREHLFRAILESIAYDYKIGLESMDRLFQHPRDSCLYTCGGGSKNRLWNQIKADVLGLTVQPIPSYHNTILGCGLLAGHGTGVFSNIEPDAIRAQGSKIAFAPDHERHAQYERYSRLYSRLFDITVHNLFDSLSEIQNE